jgi:catechol 2,3-dioxygenase-like lactoylglutathione lyase family enzyme
MSIEINGMAHVILTVSDFAAARALYGKPLPLLRMTAVCDTDKFFYCVGGRIAIGIEPCAPEHRHERFVQTRVGLHHLCVRARSREDVDACAAALKDMGATIVRGPLEGTWAPDSRLLLRFVRGPRRHSPGDQSRAWRGDIRRRHSLQSQRRLHVRPVV